MCWYLFDGHMVVSYFFLYKLHKNHIKKKKTLNYRTVLVLCNKVKWKSFYLFEKKFYFFVFLVCDFCFIQNKCLYLKCVKAVWPPYNVLVFVWAENWARSLKYMLLVFNIIFFRFTLSDNNCRENRNLYYCDKNVYATLITLNSSVLIGFKLCYLVVTYN